MLILTKYFMCTVSPLAVRLSVMNVTSQVKGGRGVVVSFPCAPSLLAQTAWKPFDYIGRST